MIRHFFINKTNTIIENSKENLGLNPISSIRYGKNIARIILYFDIEQIKNLINDKTICDLGKLTFNLKMTNCFSVDNVPYDKSLFTDFETIGSRASSFDLMLFKLPCEFDEGRGYEYMSDFWVQNKKLKITEGSTWYQSKSGIPWSINNGDNKIFKEEDFIGGIYPFVTLQEEYEKYINNEESLIVSTQHFDTGCENLNMDITKFVLSVLNGEKNYGLCLSFIPSYEIRKIETPQCVNFFNSHTNTFFHPFVEMNYSEIIKDDREKFIIGTENKLYLYVYDDGLLVNLDKLPKCIIDEKEYAVKQATKGVYYAIIDTNSTIMDVDTIHYDIWSDIVLNGQKMDDVEMEFVASGKSKRFFIGNGYSTLDVVPTLYGINDGENISIDEVREIGVEFREKFTTNIKHTISNAEYRLYVKDGDREIDVINFEPINRAFLYNYFMVYGQDLIPNKYYIDIKYYTGREVKYFKNILYFNIVNNVTERYQ
jgi:hypothetical protein